MTTRHIQFGCIVVKMREVGLAVTSFWQLKSLVAVKYWCSWRWKREVIYSWWLATFWTWPSNQPLSHSCSETEVTMALYWLESTSLDKFCNFWSLLYACHTTFQFSVSYDYNIQISPYKIILDSTNSHLTQFDWASFCICFMYFVNLIWHSLKFYLSKSWWFHFNVLAQLNLNLIV